MRIVIPESDDPIIEEAAEIHKDVTVISADSLKTATQIVDAGEADAMISGFNYSTREVILAFKKSLSVTSKYFSSCFICSKRGHELAVADGGVNKRPDKEQLYCIVEDTAITFQRCFNKQPKIAMLSYSTNGSGGDNPDLEKIHYVIPKIRQNHPDWIIDGEMQLDTAINQAVSEKKFPNSTIKGDANILIVPDLNSGNILYKALEHLGGWRVTGPIVQGFSKPLADLSRGSTVDNVNYTIEIIKKLYRAKKKEAQQS